ncbi:hypothetical protein TNCV_4360681 [Trichonephila clavipes]|uniref:Uncharacterized protein n=1 Tax=Trichonephila clavipes TaxID=2585209 RepID=A0A8X6WBE7_TRICX|nr:hypothetical protein TNCV_4360681 [Trichonephila clavipes]
MYSLWCGVVVRRGSPSSDVVHVTRPWFKMTWFVAKSPQVAEKCGRGRLVVKLWDRGWLLRSSNPEPLKTCRVEARYTLNLSRAQTSSFGMVVRRGVTVQVSFSSFDHGSKLRRPSFKSLV